MFSISGIVISILKPIRKFTTLAKTISMGQFDVKFNEVAFGELSILGKSLNVMSNSLHERDLRINELISHREEQARLEAELKVARSVQENLIPQEKLSEESSLDIFCLYEPAEECAGDWYHYGFNKDTGETVVALSDVSGHGTGSAMFTAIIASVFNEQFYDYEGLFNVEKFFEKTHNKIKRLGRSKWHTTAYVIKHQIGSSTLELYSAGHLPALFRFDQDSKSKNILLRSCLLGLKGMYEINSTKLDVKPGSTLFTFTDGLIEVFNEKNRMYGQRGAKKAFEKVAHLSPKEIVNRVLKDSKIFSNYTKAEDDTCMIAIKVK